MQEDNISPIGGYFELELPRHPEYHGKAIALNSGRFALEYILRCRQYDKVYLPYFTCDSVLEPILKLGLPYAFYHIDKEYRITDEISLNEGEGIIYTNYWGLQEDYCKTLAAKYGKQLILDYAQAFYSKPIAGIDTVYSCRKFFGVPDGGYLYTDAQPDFEMESDKSYTRMDSLVKRIDISPEAGYDDFCRVSDEFKTASLRKMSKFTKRMMQSIDYNAVAKRRMDNYNILRELLGGRKLKPGEVPMIFPFESGQGQSLRKELIAEKIFVAKYWPNVDKWAGAESTETWMANYILPLPIDQRYTEKDMLRVVQIIKTSKEDFYSDNY